MDQELLAKDFRVAQLNIREKEVKELIDDLHKPDFLQDALGFSKDVRIDLSRLIVGGHSFGGMTALQVAKSDERVKAVLTLDPWLFARNEEIMNRQFQVRQPQIHIITEGFGPVVLRYFGYDTDESMRALLDQSEASQ